MTMNAVPPKTCAGRFFFLVIDLSIQLQFRARVNHFLTQLQFVSWVELILYAVTVFPLWILFCD